MASGKTPPGQLGLDNPIWQALSTVHGYLAEGDSLAKRYPPEIAPLSGICDQSPKAYSALQDMLGVDDAAALFLHQPPAVPASFMVTTAFTIHQMICDHPGDTGLGSNELKVEILTESDVGQMLALTKLTEPGPFRRRTIELGGYRGIFSSDRKLMAMAGERLRLPGFTEVSAVCSHPDHRGKGYAKAAMLAVMSGLFHRGEVPFLHVKADNTGAIALYESIGFRFSRSLNLVVVKKAGV